MSGTSVDGEDQDNEMLVLSSIYDQDIFSYKHYEDERGTFSGTIKAKVDITSPLRLNIPPDLLLPSLDEPIDRDDIFIKYLPPVTLSFTLPPNYPSRAPPHYTLHCQWLTLKQLTLVCRKLDQVACDAAGSVVLFLWMEFIQHDLLPHLDITNTLDMQRLIRFGKISEARNLAQCRAESESLMPDTATSSPEETPAAPSIDRCSETSFKEGFWDSALHLAKFCFKRQEEVSPHKDDTSQEINQVAVEEDWTAEIEEARANSHPVAFKNNREEKAEDWSSEIDGVNNGHFQGFGKNTVGIEEDWTAEIGVTNGCSLVLDTESSGMRANEIGKHRNRSGMKQNVSRQGKKSKKYQSQSGKHMSQSEKQQKKSGIQESRTGKEESRVGKYENKRVKQESRNGKQKDKTVECGKCCIVNESERGRQHVVQNSNSSFKSPSTRRKRKGGCNNINRRKKGRQFRACIDRRVSNSEDMWQSLVRMLLEYSLCEEERAFSLSLVFCDVCGEDKLGSESVRFKPCQHIYCRSCVQGYYEVLIREGSVKSLFCPHPECDVQPLPQMVQGVVSSQAFARYEWLLLKTSLDSMTDVVYCPRCEAVIIADPDSNACLCEHCTMAFCRMCRLTYHGINPCKLGTGVVVKKLLEEYEMSEPAARAVMDRRYGKRNLQRALEDMRSEETIEKSTKKCPACSATIERSYGCNKMLCTKCHEPFCWLCMSVLNKHDPYRHYWDAESKCYNLLFEETDDMDEWVEMEDEEEMIDEMLELEGEVYLYMDDEDGEDEGEVDEDELEVNHLLLPDEIYLNKNFPAVFGI